MESEAAQTSGLQWSSRRWISASLSPHVSFEATRQWMCPVSFWLKQQLSLLLVFFFFDISLFLFRVFPGFFRHLMLYRGTQKSRETSESSGGRKIGTLESTSCFLLLGASRVGSTSATDPQLFHLPLWSRRSRGGGRRRGGLIDFGGPQGRGAAPSSGWKSWVLSVWPSGPPIPLIPQNTTILCFPDGPTAAPPVVREGCGGGRAGGKGH